MNAIVFLKHLILHQKALKWHSYNTVTINLIPKIPNMEVQLTIKPTEIQIKL